MDNIDTIKFSVVNFNGCGNVSDTLVENVVRLTQGLEDLDFLNSLLGCSRILNVFVSQNGVCVEYTYDWGGRFESQVLFLQPNRDECSEGVEVSFPKWAGSRKISKHHIDSVEATLDFDKLRQDDRVVVHVNCFAEDSVMIPLFSFNINGFSKWCENPCDIVVVEASDDEYNTLVSSMMGFR